MMEPFSAKDVVDAARNGHKSYTYLHGPIVGYIAARKTSAMPIIVAEG